MRLYANPGYGGPYEVRCVGKVVPLLSRIRPLLAMSSGVSAAQRRE